MLRAQAYKAARQNARAAKDYQLLYYKNPLSDEGKTAATALPQMKAALGNEYPVPSLELQEQRAQIFYDQHKWKEARAEFEKLAASLKDPANPHRQHALLRAAQARVQLKGSPSLVSSLAITDPEVDAERIFDLAQIYRSAKKESEMLSSTEQRRAEISFQQMVRRSADDGRQLLLGGARSRESGELLPADAG